MSEVIQGEIVEVREVISEMELVSQMSSTKCVKNVNFGFQGTFAWSVDGCRAEYSLVFCKGTIIL